MDVVLKRPANANRGYRLAGGPKAKNNLGSGATPWCSLAPVLSEQVIQFSRSYSAECRLSRDIAIHSRVGWFERTGGPPREMSLADETLGEKLIPAVGTQSLTLGPGNKGPEMTRHRLSRIWTGSRRNPKRIPRMWTNRFPAFAS